MLDHSNLFALLIDGDNLQVSFVPQILDKIHEYGNPIIKNVYLNRNSLTSEWDELINEHTIQPIYVPNNTPRKNAVDIAITIDAMELLFERKDLSGFCIISSDSDFTRLADYIVRKSRFVLGMGEDKTPASFQNACSEFIRIEDLTQTKNTVKPSQNTTVPAKTTPYDTYFGIVFARAYEKLTNGADSWVQLMNLKEEMNALDDNFQSSEYRNTRRFAEKIEALGQTLPNSVIDVQIFENQETNQLIHHICLNYELFMFIEAYKHVPNKEQGGWVQLSRIGDVLANMGSGFSYKGFKQPKTVVTQMSQDFPKLIKIREKIKGNKSVDVVRVKL